jgi:hypothetical protein
MVVVSAVHIIVNAPLMMPEAPDPAMARLTMSMSELVETPHNNDASSKIKRNARNAYYENQHAQLVCGM